MKFQLSNHKALAVEAEESVAQARSDLLAIVDQIGRQEKKIVL